MIASATLGFPRIGQQRELKQALEAHWQGTLDAPGLERAAAGLRSSRWLLQKHHGIGVVPSNDFSLYDHVLDASCLVSAIPARFAAGGGAVDGATYFRMARGGPGVAALEMTKWFDTNYHYLVPELTAATRFRADARKPLGEWREALALGIRTRPVLLGPVTFLLLAKRIDGGDPLALLPGLVEAYADVLRALAAAGVEWIQFDEPALAGDLGAPAHAAYRTAYAALAQAAPGLRLLLATYFGTVAEVAGLLAQLPIDGLHLDLVRAPQQLERVLCAWPRDRLLSLGVVDGRGVWIADYDRALALVARATASHPAALLQVAPSCSLLHVPLDAERERGLDPQVAATLAFAVQKLQELNRIAATANGPAGADSPALTARRKLLAQRAASPFARDAAVRARASAVAPGDAQRASPFAMRDRAQRDLLKLPLLPTTTIGSFPQTAEVRRQRAAFKEGRAAEADYLAFLRAETAACIRFQEDIGLDVLVHGEFERNDMVEYFGEQLAGFAFTGGGWVQSYGSRCVKPPLIVGDVSRPQAMTVSWACYAQGLTSRPVKGMLTGPLTMLQWSFVRDDLPRDQVCRQIALALRDEILDLERAGIAIIQVDEPALREGLPLRRADQAAYLKWAVDCFRLATGGVGDGTQIHTHMCYSEFHDIIGAIAALDADVISIETARSRMELLAAFEAASYPNGIGPGIYDIHSPEIPEAAAMGRLIARARRSLRIEQLWVNPDCGLKTRGWSEVRTSLQRMVEAAQGQRQVR
jgi:5-methyltetrahydropteroyltriglutamate--homocysteine methyltransferase